MAIRNSIDCGPYLLVRIPDVCRSFHSDTIVMRAVAILIVALFCATVSVHGGAIKSINGRAGACSFSVTGGMGEPQPLIMTPGTTKFKRSADTKGTLSFDANEEVTLACPGTGNYVTVSGNT